MSAQLIACGEIWRNKATLKELVIEYVHTTGVGLYYVDENGRVIRSSMSKDEFSRDWAKTARRA